MLQVGLTGGIACGKTLVSGCFERLGVPVVDADAAARAVVAPGSDGLAAVVEGFGEAVLDGNGALDRSSLRARIFDDDAARARLEAILHPRIRAWMDAAVESHRRDGHALVVRAVPLLVETGQAAHCDRVLVVDAPTEVQRRRLQSRDGIDAPAADAMLASQAGRWQRLRAATDVVLNGDDVAPERGIACQVAALARKYRRLAALPTD